MGNGSPGSTSAAAMQCPAGLVPRTTTTCPGKSRKPAEHWERSSLARAPPDRATLPSSSTDWGLSRPSSVSQHTRPTKSAASWQATATGCEASASASPQPSPARAASSSPSMPRMRPST